MAKKKTSLGCLFWISLILLVLVVFFFNRERITEVLEETGFSDYINLEKEQEAPEVRRKNVEEGEESQENRQDKAPQELRIETEEEEKPQGDEQVELPTDKDEKEVEETSGGTEKPKIEQKLRKASLYFVSVDDSGTISLRRIVRPVYYTDSPLTATMETLMKGLTPTELNEGLLNLIPDNTQIRKIWIEGNIAYIDFSEELRFNPFGIEGIQAALRQIVYTATEFSTVEGVQILINGEKRSYIASEGLRIGTPLRRGDLNS